MGPRPPRQAACASCRSTSRSMGSPHLTRVCPDLGRGRASRREIATEEGGGGRRNLECGTTQVSQILPRYFKDRNHFSRCHFYGSWQAQPPGAVSTHPEANRRGVCVFLCHNRRILCHILRRYLRVGAKSSPHQILPFQIPHVPHTHPLPPGTSRTAP